MATKKKAVAIENLAAKTVATINADIAKLQTNVREALGTIGEALASNLEELEGLKETITLTKEELSQLHGKERVMADLQQLEYELNDAKREHARQIRALEQDVQDRHEEYNRKHNALIAEAAIIEADHCRTRSIKIEDEDRQRQLDFQQRERLAEEREAALAKREEDIGSFKDRVEAEVAKRTKAISREAEIKYMKTISGLEADTKVLDARANSLEGDKAELARRIERLEAALTAANSRVSAIATSALDKEAGKAALDELRSVAHKQAEGKK